MRRRLAACPGRRRPGRSPTQPAGDARRGAELAPLCTSCHGRDGRSQLSRYPSIAGLEPERFRERMAALQAGEGGHLLMRMTRNLSEQDIADLAAHFATLE
ncbi:c-type cytochrome [Halomonas sp. BM-2019]|uniref:c-type cytochrome n=1 Tax=Halomonas sp. BM-2019 TaxID=2811227 RepID=UPI0031FC069A